MKYKLVNKKLKMMIARIYLCMCVLLTSGAVADAILPLVEEDPVSQSRRWRSFDHENDGFPDGQIRVVYPGQDGAIWFAGRVGVYRFDGLNWKDYWATHRSEETDNFDTNVIIQSGNKDIWVGSNKGVIRFYGDSWEDCDVFGYDDKIPGQIVKAICETSDKKIWVGCGTLPHVVQSDTLGGGVASWDGKQWHVYDVDALAHHHVNDILEDKNKTLWIATNGGITHFDYRKGIWTSFSEENMDWPFEQILSIHEDSDGILWFGAAGGIIRYRPEDQDSPWTFYKLTESASTEENAFNVFSIGHTSDGVLWAYVDDQKINQALYRFLGGKWEQCEILGDGPGQIGYAKMGIAKNDVIWLAGRRLVRFDYGNDAKWLSYEWLSGPPHQDGVKDGLWFPIGAKAEDNSKVELNGTVFFSQKTWKSYQNINWPVYRAKDGTLWSGGKGIFSSESKTPHPGLDTCKHILQDQMGRIWFIGKINAPGKGLIPAVVRYDGESPKNFTKDTQHEKWHLYTNHWEEATPLARRVREAPNGDIWFLPDIPDPWFGYGIIRFDAKKEQWHHYLGDSEAVKYPVDQRRMYDLDFDLTGSVWVGAGDGLWFFNSKTETWKRIEGVPSKRKIVRVYATPDAIWLGCDESQSGKNGVIRYNFKEGIWDTFTTHTTQNGLVANHVWEIYQSQDGAFWFGTVKGVSRFDGQYWDAYETKDGLYKEDVRYIYEDLERNMWFGRGHFYDVKRRWTTRYKPERQSPDTRLTFLPGETLSSGNVIFEWSGWDTWKDTDSSELVFSYQLDDAPWSPYKSNTKEIYSELDSGYHTFRVRARDKAANVDSTPAEYQFYVTPQIWEQAWFIGLILTLLGGIGYQSIRVVKRGRDLSISNKALSEVNLNLKQEILERERLDTQIQDLQFLYSLRASLGDKQTPQDVVRTVGDALVDVVGVDGGVVIHLDDRLYSFGQITAGEIYERILIWGERERGLLKLHCPFALSESQERTLLDEATGQLVRVLEARELQMQLLQSARLVSLGQMAAGVAHELNQPLGGISATAEDYYLRLQDDIPVSNDQFKDIFKRILGMVDRMTSTVEHLRVFSRDTAEESDELVAINDVIYSTLDIIGTQLRNHSIEVVQELSDNLPKLEGHPYQIEQIFLNLLGNARDALDARQSDTTFFKRIVIRTRVEDDLVVVEVEDNGVGITLEDLPHIFEPFFTTKSAEEGTGLGLSITYAIVKNHGGNITCQSRPNQNTKFQVTFPISSQTE